MTDKEIKAHMDTQKAAIDAQLETGMLSQERYDAHLEALKVWEKAERALSK